MYYLRYFYAKKAQKLKKSKNEKKIPKAWKSQERLLLPEIQKSSLKTFKIEIMWLNADLFLSLWCLIGPLRISQLFV